MSTEKGQTPAEPLAEAPSTRQEQRSVNPASHATAGANAVSETTTMPEFGSLSSVNPVIGMDPTIAAAAAVLAPMPGGMMAPPPMFQPAPPQGISAGMSSSAWLVLQLTLSRQTRLLYMIDRFVFGVLRLKKGMLPPLVERFN